VGGGLVSDPERTLSHTGTLSDEEIIDLCGRGHLITESFQVQNVKQACYELRAGSIYYRPAEGNHRETVANEQCILIKPKQLIVIITMETVEIPPDILGRVLSKGVLFSLGLLPVNTYADPGFSGRLGIVLFNAANNYVKIEPGDPIAKIEFTRLAVPVARPYRGQHGYLTQVWPLAEQMILSERELRADPRVGTSVEELTRAYGSEFGTVLNRIFRYERWLIVSAFTYLLFALALIALTQKPGGAQLSAWTAIGLGVVSNVATSVLILAATRLLRSWGGGRGN
jgi:dCTP deaminase